MWVLVHFIAYVVAILLIVLLFPFLILIKTPLPIVIIVLLLIFLLLPSLITRAIEFLISRALEGVRAVFGKGKIDIAISKTYYTPGDIISGNATLILKKPVNAREVSISLSGEEITKGGEGILAIILSRGNSVVSHERRRIYDFKHQLDGEKEYSQGGEYRFEIKIPADILGVGPQALEGKLGQTLKVAQTASAIAGLTPLQETPEQEGKQNRGLEVAKTMAAGMGLIRLQRTKWYLSAKLDIPRGLDISKKVDITIG